MSKTKKKQRKNYSGKKKKHTIKTQVVVDKKSKKIICTDFCEGKKHDFQLFKDSKIQLLKYIQILADSGFQGIVDEHGNSKIPKKSSKNNPLTKGDKRENRELSSKRILVENVIGKAKFFRILSGVYRNRRRRFSLRFNLISGIYNFELKQKC